MTELRGPDASMRDRLLDAGERVLAADGLAGLTVRAVTTEAGVNIATVNYVFGTKDALLIGLQERMFAPMTAERLARLGGLDRSPRPALRDLVRALLEPLDAMRREHGAAAIELHRHLAAHPEGRVRSASWDLLLPVLPAFERLVARALPDVGGDELTERVHLVCRIASTVVLESVTPDGKEMTGQDLERWIDFVTAGLAGPTPPGPAAEPDRSAAGGPPTG